MKVMKTPTSLKQLKSRFVQQQPYNQGTIASTINEGSDNITYLEGNIEALIASLDSTMATGCTFPVMC